VGAVPALWGGAAEAGSKTAAEYSMSRAQAQQRLQITWKMLIVFWQDIFKKVIPAYIENLVEDETYVKQDEMGSFINATIKKSEMEGRIGEVFLEASDQLPVTWAQKKDVIMKLMELNNPAILQMIASPENVELLKSGIGLEDFTVPGELDRQKQYDEIHELIHSEPYMVPSSTPTGAIGMDGQPVMEQGEIQVPSVPIDPILDNHEVESAVCRAWLVGEVGRVAKVDNPRGYLNVLLHYKAHIDQIAKTMMQGMGGQVEDGANPDQPKGDELTPSAPIQEVRNATTGN
jgi:hypothetical protein